MAHRSHSKQLFCTRRSSSYDFLIYQNVMILCILYAVTFTLEFLGWCKFCSALSHSNGVSHVLQQKGPSKNSQSFRHPQDSATMRDRYAHRKLLLGLDAERTRDKCKLDDILIIQGEAGPLPDGIPSFTVEIINVCITGCPMSDIHVSCGWFASAKLIDSKLFKRVKYNDCIVNDRLPLKGGESIVFVYASSFQYPLEVSSVNPCCS